MAWEGEDWGPEYDEYVSNNPATEVSNEALIRAHLWSKVMKEALLNDLVAMRFVRIETTTTATFAPVSLPVAVAMGAAAIVIKNPVISRRFWRKD